jgi:hypothetical protein
MSLLLRHCKRKNPLSNFSILKISHKAFDDNVVYEVNDEGGDGTKRNEEGLQEMADTLSRDEKK